MKKAAFLLALLGSLIAAPTAAAVPEPIDQASWAAKKRHVILPNGIRLAYVELGNPDGEPVLLLHGFTDSSRAWTILAPWLLEHRLLILDQRGHGASDRPECCYSVAEFANDAKLFLDAVKAEQVSVVGHSLGSMVAQRLAADIPNRIRRIALLGSTALAPVRRGDWLWQQVVALREPVSSNSEFLDQWSFGASPTSVDPVFVRHSDAEAAQVPLHVWRAIPRELLDAPAGRFAPDIRAKVLILSAEQDQLFTPEHHASLKAAFPQADVHLFPDLGHNFIAERPRQVAALLMAFLSN